MTVLFRMARYSHSRGIAKYFPLTSTASLMMENATADSPERVLPFDGPRGVAIHSLLGRRDMVQSVTAANRLGVSKGTMMFVWYVDPNLPFRHRSPYLSHVYWLVQPYPMYPYFV